MHMFIRAFPPEAVCLQYNCEYLEYIEISRENYA